MLKHILTNEAKDVVSFLNSKSRTFGISILDAIDLKFYRDGKLRNS